MIRKSSRYTVLMFGWGLLVFGATVAMYSGMAAPYLTPAMLPGTGPIAFVAYPAGLLALGGLTVGHLKKRAWRRAGKRAGLTPDGRGLFGESDLVGTSNGRTVRARTIKLKTGGGGESGSNKSKFTIVEADLAAPAEEGLLIGHSGNTGPSSVKLGDADVETTSVGEYEVVGGSKELANEVLTSRVQSALSKPEMRESVLVGNATEMLVESIPEGDGVLSGTLTRGLKTKLSRELPGEADTVRIKTDDTLLDSDEMGRQVEAVAAVAEGFEASTAR